MGFLCQKRHVPMSTDPSRNPQHITVNRVVPGSLRLGLKLKVALVKTLLLTMTLLTNLQLVNWLWSEA